MIYRLFKRTSDFLAALLLILLFSPVLLLLMLLICLESRGGAIFSQIRVGKETVPFKLYKLRSMKSGSYDAKNPSFTKENDARITKLGAFIRKTSLDEIPQLFNILKGEMSFIGPRPDTPFQKNGYSESDWNNRHKVLPGVTGWAQVNGRSSLSQKQRIGFDLEYVDKISLKLDLIIYFKTLLLVLRRTKVN